MKEFCIHIFAESRQDTLAVQILFSSGSSSVRVLETQRNVEHQRIKPSNSKVLAHFKNPIILELTLIIHIIYSFTHPFQNPPKLSECAV